MANRVISGWTDHGTIEDGAEIPEGEVAIVPESRIFEVNQNLEDPGSSEEDEPSNGDEDEDNGDDSTVEGTFLSAQYLRADGPELAVTIVESHPESAPRDFEIYARVYSDDSWDVFWDHAPDATEYILRDGNGTQIYSTAEPELTLKHHVGELAEGSHTFEVEAINSYGSITRDLTIDIPESWNETEATTLHADGTFTNNSHFESFYDADTNQTIFSAIQGNGDIVVGGYDHDNDQPLSATTLANLPANTHHVPQIIKLPSGKYLCAYPDHNDMWCRRTTNPGDISQWDAEVTIHDSDTDGGRATYCALQYLEEEDAVYVGFTFRDDQSGGGRGPYSFKRSTDGGDTWSDLIQVFKSVKNGEDQRPYGRLVAHPNGKRLDFLANDGNRIDDGNDDGTNEVRHWYYEEGSFYRTDGSHIADEGSADLPFEREDLEPVFEVEQDEKYVGHPGQIGFQKDKTPILALHVNWPNSRATAAVRKDGDWHLTPLGRGNNPVWIDGKRFTYRGHGDEGIRIDYVATYDKGESFYLKTLVFEENWPDSRISAPTFALGGEEAAMNVVYPQGEWNGRDDYDQEIKAHTISLTKDE